MANVGAVIARIITQYSDKGSKAAQRDAKKLEKSFDTFSKRAKLAFAGAAVTNLVEETTKPTIISAETNTGGIGRTVFVKMSELTNPNSPSGFDVKVNNLSRTFSATAGTTSYLSTTVTICFRNRHYIHC